MRVLLMSLKKKRYDLNQCALYKCRGKGRLAYLLHMNKEEFDNLEKLIEYYSFTTDKNDGDKRLITAPRNNLKKIQKRILKLITFVKRPEWLISGERGKNYIDNGKFHQQSHYLLTMDIKKFYENCKREFVYRFFRYTMCMSGDIAEILTNIVTLEQKIPTGCPTSQLIAYYAYQEMFENIKKIANKYNCVFTLYVDDMTFSSKRPFNPDKLRNEIDIELRKYGHRPKYSKVQYYSRNSNKLVTGVVISKDHNLLVANKLQKKIYDNAMKLKKVNGNKKEAKIAYQLESDLRSLKGQLQAARNVKKGIFPEINRLVENSMINLSK